MPTPNQTTKKLIAEMVRTIEIVTFPYDNWTDKDKETVSNILKKTINQIHQQSAEAAEGVVKNLEHGKECLGEFCDPAFCDLGDRLVIKRAMDADAAYHRSLIIE